jgi:hypothetical protein
MTDAKQGSASFCKKKQKLWLSGTCAEPAKTLYKQKSFGFF